MDAASNLVGNMLKRVVPNDTFNAVMKQITPEVFEEIMQNMSSIEEGRTPFEKCILQIGKETEIRLQNGADNPSEKDEGAR